MDSALKYTLGEFLDSSPLVGVPGTQSRRDVPSSSAPARQSGIRDVVQG